MLRILVILANILYYINCACSDITPNLNTDCIKESTQLAYCCYVYNGSQKSCYEQNRLAWKNASSNMVNINGLSLAIDCGVGAETNSITGPLESSVVNNIANINSLNDGSLPDAGPSCGIANPVTFQDCASYSMFGNSCCLYEYSGKKNCYSLGKSWRGSATYGSINVTCAGGWLYTSSLLLLLVLFFI
jgi:hypothetical protein